METQQIKRCGQDSSKHSEYQRKEQRMEERKKWMLQGSPVNKTTASEKSNRRVLWHLLGFKQKEPLLAAGWRLPGPDPKGGEHLQGS